MGENKKETFDWDEVERALRLIRSVCNDYSKCADCPLRRDDTNCGLASNPDRWQFASDDAAKKIFH